MSRRRKPLPPAPVTVRVDGMEADGRGVARVDGKVVFIDGALPGELVSFRYTRVRGRFDEGRTEEVLEPSPSRGTPRCAHFGTCGGCSLQHMEHRAQVDAKQAQLLESLTHIGKVTPGEILPPLVDEPWAYRRKARLGVRFVRARQSVLVGFRERRSSFVAALEGCEVLHPSVGRRIAALRALLDGLSARQRIAQVEVAVGDEDTALVLRNLDPLDDADTAALVDFARTHGLQVYLQPGGPDSVTPLWPREPSPLSYSLPEFDLDMHFEPTDFTQVNAGINRRLVSRAVALLDPVPGEQVLDLFCGIGNFTLPIARRGARVTGVEGGAALVERARQNAARNGLDGVDFVDADLSLPDRVEACLAPGWDKLFVDPPRSGALEVMRAVGARPPRRIVYVSCNPATLARDAGVLVDELGYGLRSAGVVDMFPHTNHVESMAVFDAPA